MSVLRTTTDRFFSDNNAGANIVTWHVLFESISTHKFFGIHLPMQNLLVNMLNRYSDIELNFVSRMGGAGIAARMSREHIIAPGIQDAFVHPQI